MSVDIPVTSSGFHTPSTISTSISSSVTGSLSTSLATHGLPALGSINTPISDISNMSSQSTTDCPSSTPPGEKHVLQLQHSVIQQRATLPLSLCQQPVTLTLQQQADTVTAELQLKSEMIPQLGSKIPSLNAADAAAEGDSNSDNKAMDKHAEQEAVLPQHSAQVHASLDKLRASSFPPAPAAPHSPTHIVVKKLRLTMPSNGGKQESENKELDNNTTAQPAAPSDDSSAAPEFTKHPSVSSVKSPVDDHQLSEEEDEHDGEEGEMEAEEEEEEQDEEESHSDDDKDDPSVDASGNVKSVRAAGSSCHVSIQRCWE